MSANTEGLCGVSEVGSAQSKYCIEKHLRTPCATLTDTWSLLVNVSCLLKLVLYITHLQGCEHTTHSFAGMRQSFGPAMHTPKSLYRCGHRGWQDGEFWGGTADKSLYFQRILFSSEEKAAQGIKAPNVSVSRFRVILCLCLCCAESITEPLGLCPCNLRDPLNIACCFGGHLHHTKIQTLGFNQLKGSFPTFMPPVTTSPTYLLDLKFVLS